MADTSSYSIEERLVASVWVRVRQHMGQTMSQVMAAFREWFNKAPPWRATLVDWEKRAFAFGSVKDRPRSGWKTTRLETCSGCCFHWTFPNEVDMETIVRAWCATVNNARPHEERLECEAISPNFREWTVGWRHGSALWIMPCYAGHILKSRSPLKGSFQWWMCQLLQCARQKCCVLVKGDPNFMQELEHNPPHVMIWAGITSDYLIGPYFFDGPVNAASYWATLESWLIPQLRDRGLLDDVWLQHNGAPAHFALSVREILNERFPGRWIGRGSPTSLAPLPWSPHSPDLTTPDNSLWGIIKGRVAARRYNNNEDLRRAVEDSFRTITPKMLRRMSQRTWRRIPLCVQHQGAHTDSLDI